MGLGLGLTDFVVVLTTFPADGDVEQFARSWSKNAGRVRKHLADDAIDLSWKERSSAAEERQFVIKTTSSASASRNANQGLHPYDVPEFVVIPIIHGSHDYLSWLSENTNPEVSQPASP